MNPLLRFVLPAALACGILASPRASAQDDPRALIDWLRVLAIETRLSYQFDDPPDRVGRLRRVAAGEDRDRARHAAQGSALRAAAAGSSTAG